jgi:hypothetical protein
VKPRYLSRFCSNLDSYRVLNAGFAAFFHAAPSASHLLIAIQLQKFRRRHCKAEIAAGGHVAATLSEVCIRAWLMRLYLKGDAPPEIATLLDSAGFELVSPADTEAADLTVAFDDEPLRPGYGRFPIRLRIEYPGGAAGTEAGENFTAESAVHAASIVVSRCFGRHAPMVTGDEATFRAISTALRAPANVPFLLEGETGVGKQTLARIIHAASGARGDFVPVDCSLVEGEEPRASLTEAEEILAAVGGVAAWKGKTIFFDNVDELPPAMQARALGAIRAHARAREGGARYVASSRRPLGEMVRRGLFNRDLYEALAPLTVRLPALRERGSDIQLLARNFLIPRLSFTPAALRALSEYPFPGNVRELKNLVKRLAIVPLEASGGMIDAPDVREQIIVATRQKAEHPRPSWRAAVEAANREIALRTVAALGGDINAAARKLGVSAAALRRSIRSAGGISIPRRR